MRAVVLLAAAYLRERPLRTLLTSLATVASVAMVVWVASGYDTLLVTFDEYANKALGHYPLTVAPIGRDAELAVPQDAIEALRGDPQVAGAHAMCAHRVPLRPAKPRPPQPSPAPARSGGPGGMGRGLSPSGGPGGMGRGGPPGGGPGRGPRSLSDVLGGHLLLGTDAPLPPFDMLDGRWLGPASADGDECALSAGAAERLGVSVGDTVVAGKGARKRTLTVVGVLDTPRSGGTTGQAAVAQFLTPAAGDVFVPWTLAERITGQQASARIVGLALAEGVDVTRFRFGWAHRLSRFGTPVQFQEAHDIEERLDETASADNVRMQGYAATGVAMLVAFLVILSTLSMGVSEKTRQLALLRAVLLTRAQVALLVGVEALMLAVIGLAGGLGLGYLILVATARASAGLLHHGVVLGSHSVGLGAICALGGALIGAILPAHRATRVRPLDAVAPRPRSAADRRIRPLLLVAGLVLLAINPLLAFVFPPGSEGGVVGAAAIGFITMAVGFVLLAPPVVALVDRLVRPALARVLRLEPTLLASQVTVHLWRTVGAAASMTVGLGLFIGIQVWGFTMLDGFIPGPWTPDALLSFSPAGLPTEHVAEVAKLPGVDPERCLPIVVEQPRLLKDLTHSAEQASVVRQDNVVLVGIEPERGLGGERPLLDLEWVAGSPAEALPLLQQGRACVVPDHFLRVTGLKVGDPFELVPPKDPTRPVAYTIAGAVRLPGWHWQTKHTNMRPRTHRAAALVFADYPSVARDFDMKSATHVWFDHGPDGAHPELAAQARALYARVLGEEVPERSMDPEAPAVLLRSSQQLRDMTRASAKRWIWVVSQVPLIALLVACFGVLNVILASVRSRRWELGVLRSLGFTRSVLVRLVVAEGVLIGVVASLLSLGFGGLGGWCGVGLAQQVSFFGGMHPSLVLPGVPIGAGLLGALLLGGLAAIWPALGIARTSPLTLLQQGRSAF